MLRDLQTLHCPGGNFGRQKHSCCVGGILSPTRYLLYSTESSWINFIRRLPKRADRCETVSAFFYFFKIKRNRKTIVSTPCKIFSKLLAPNLTGQESFLASSRGRKAGRYTNWTCRPASGPSMVQKESSNSKLLP